MPFHPALKLRPLPTAAAAAAAAAGAAFWLTPWPAALLIRGVFYRGAQQLVRQMRPHAPAVSEHLGLDYEADGGTRQLDLFLPPGHTPQDPSIPVIVWVHGGAWISGSRHDVAPYLRMLAARGYAAVGVDYSVAPGSRYPQALHELDAAVAFLQKRAGSYGLDMERVVLAGDSAGAQLASQLSAAVTSPAYAAALGFTPALPAGHLRAAVLHCGVYDLEAMGRLTGILGWGFRTALWAYTGRRRFAGSAAAKQMSVISNATGAFPPAFISGGNGDGLTLQQSVPFADRLRELGVPVTARFWPQDLSPALPHEAQFHFSRPEARAVLEETAAFLDTVIARPADRPPV
ncbi:alpha/beta hydrolase [Arthrobacter sp. 3Tela_A]|uniref:alpha/beta hydrolase n=1 Tax=Arthrobacter sp. 3Tela_A TaxID=3093743 RepID=UPI003BB72CE3